MNRLVIGNLLHRPLRSSISILAIAIEVAMILSIVGILFTQNGFQASSLSASLPALEASEPVIASIVGIVLLHEHLNGRTTFDNVAIGLSIIALLASVITLASMAGHDAAATGSASEPAREDDDRAKSRTRAVARPDRYRPRIQPAARRRSRSNR